MIITVVAVLCNLQNRLSLAMQKFSLISTVIEGIAFDIHKAASSLITIKYAVTCNWHLNCHVCAISVPILSQIVWIHRYSEFMSTSLYLIRHQFNKSVFLWPIVSVTTPLSFKNNRSSFKLFFIKIPFNSHHNE